MMVRKYGLRSEDLTGSYSGGNSLSDVVLDSPSQDVYNFTLSSQDSAQCQWSDPYGLSSSHETRQLTVFPGRKGGECVDCDGEFRKPKKVNVIDVDLDDYGLSSSQESRDLEIPSPRDGREVDSWNSKKAKKVHSDPYRFNSSPELEEFKVVPQRKDGENRILEFSDGEFWESEKFKNVDSISYPLNSSHKSNELRVSLPRKIEDNGTLKFDEVSRRSKPKAKRENMFLKKKRDKMDVKEPGSRDVCLTATLMEAQEFGEMMEHMDEVNFALDGLKKGQQVAIRRASLLSLLSICGTAQQRRLLRVHGMSKIIIDAVLGLIFDDPACNLAAAALFYILTRDGQDDHLLDSPNFVRFLVKLLKPLTSTAARDNAPRFGGKLLRMCKNTNFLQNSSKGTNSSSAAIMLKVQEMLINCKEIKPRSDCDGRIANPELNPKWISLLIMEKACLSVISIEGNSGTARKTGVRFKEKLREFGGLYAAFEEARRCHFVIEEWLELSPSLALDSKDILESLVLLLKCLRIMENATFLSKDNQCHLLGMKGNFDGQRAPHSFTKLILSFIKSLSGASLCRSFSRNSYDKVLCDASNMNSRSGCSMEWNTSQNSINGSQCNQFLLSGQPDSHMDDSQDPFAFDEDDFEPSKWDLLSGRLIPCPLQESRATMSGFKDGNCSLAVFSQQRTCDTENCHNQQTSCSSPVDEEKSILLADCLLTAVKVLMNLTNNNPEGCQQIAICGGLEILSSLIACHFSACTISLPHLNVSRESSLSSKSSPSIDHQSYPNLCDQELDFLVAILGLLVNLIEKDSRNRARLAAINVDGRDVISLLCSIFLANQEAEAAGEGQYLSWEDEDSILQGEKEAEKMIVEAYAALLLAFLSTESKGIRNSIAQCLPKQNLAILVPVLERFVEFHLTLNMISPETHTAVLEVIESCRIH